MKGLEEQMNIFEKKKLEDIKSVLQDYVLTEISFNAKSLELFTKAFQDLQNISIEDDVEVCHLFLNSLDQFITGWCIVWSFIISLSGFQGCAQSSWLYISFGHSQKDFFPVFHSPGFTCQPIHNSTKVQTFLWLWISKITTQREECQISICGNILWVLKSTH